MAEVVVFGVVAADIILRVQRIPAPGNHVNAEALDGGSREFGQRGLRAQLGWAPRTPRRTGRQGLNGRQSPGRTRTAWR